MKISLLLSMLATLPLIACSHSGGAGGAPQAANAGDVVWKDGASSVKPEDTPDLPSLSKAAGDATFQSLCTNPINPIVQAGETEVVGGFIKLQGQWQLESMRSFTRYDDKNSDWAPGTLSGEYRNGHTQVLCHNSMSDQSRHRSLNTELNVPYEIDGDRAQMISQATLLLQARNGSVGGQLQLESMSKAITSTDNPPSNVRVVLVRTPDGQVIFRLIMAVDGDSPGQTTTFSVEATYRRKS